MPEPLRAVKVHQYFTKVLCIVLCSIQSIQFVINVLVYCDNMTCIALTQNPLCVCVIVSSQQTVCPLTSI